MKKTSAKRVVLIVVFAMVIGMLASCNAEWLHVHKFSSTYYYDKKYHWTQCSCNEKSELELHLGGIADCMTQAKCNICGQAYGELNPHEYTKTSYDADSHWKECVCGAKDALVEHNYVLTWNENGHWLACSCGAKVNEEAHTGGDANCETAAECEVCKQTYGTLKHEWNDGELTVPSSESTEGTIRYTCKICMETKNEIIPAGTEIITRADIENALVSVAWAYYMKGTKIQYDSESLSQIGGHYGGICRHTRDASPEFGTSDTSIYSVCT